jgi:hypothetical protein
MWFLWVTFDGTTLGDFVSGYGTAWTVLFWIVIIQRVYRVHLPLFSHVMHVIRPTRYGSSWGLPTRDTCFDTVCITMNEHLYIYRSIDKYDDVRGSFLFGTFFIICWTNDLNQMYVKSVDVLHVALSHGGVFLNIIASWYRIDQTISMGGIEISRRTYI